MSAVAEVGDRGDASGLSAGGSAEGPGDALPEPLGVVASDLSARRRNTGDAAADDIVGEVAPVAVLRPPAGTALLWGGTLLHAGAEVTEGRRLVFVASFTPGLVAA